MAIYELTMRYGINSELGNYNEVGRLAQKIFNAVNDEIKGEETMFCCMPTNQL